MRAQPDPEVDGGGHRQDERRQDQDHLDQAGAGGLDLGHPERVEAGRCQGDANALDQDRPQAGPQPAQPAQGADELVAGGPPPRQPHQDHPNDPAKERDHQHDEGDHLEPGGGRPGRPGRDAEALAGLGGDVGRVAEALQHGADSGLGLGVELGPAGGDVLADLVEELLASVGGQVTEGCLQVLEVAEDQGVGLGGHQLPPCCSRRSTAPVKRSHSVAKRASACWPCAVSW